MRFVVAAIAYFLMSRDSFNLDLDPVLTVDIARVARLRAE
jgi:hypothetical protein